MGEEVQNIVFMKINNEMTQISFDKRCVSHISFGEEYYYVPVGILSLGGASRKIRLRR